MMSRDRRIGVRVPLEIFINQYMQDRPVRALAENLSETGIYLQRVVQPDGPPRPRTARCRLVGLELELPGTGEVIWARGEICYEQRGGERFLAGSGIRFDDMPRCHARMVRDFCREARRARLSSLLGRVRGAAQEVPPPGRVVT